MPLAMDLNASISDFSAVTAKNPDPGQQLLSLLLSPYALVAAIIGISAWRTICDHKGNALVQAPNVGSRLAWFARIGYFMDAKRVIEVGHAQFKNTVFKLSGNDVVVLPSKYVDELRNMPNDKLNAILALVENAEGAFALTDVLTTSNLHTRVIQTRLTPKLGTLVPSVRQELDFAFDKDFPKCAEEWTFVEVYHVLHQIVGRASARVFVGPDLCRDERWLEAAEGYTNNVFITIVALRLLPFWAKPIACFFLPSSWKIHHHWWQARRLLLPLITKWKRERDSGEVIAKDGLGNFLQMLMDEAGDGPDSDPVTIAKRVLSLTLASNHTTTMALAETLYDLCAHPDYIDEIRKEAQQAVTEDGGWRKTTLTKMRKLDSFMKESQRVNPPSYMGFKRRVMQPLTLQDGLTLPAGAHIEMAIVPIQRDNTDHPDCFDGLRYYKKRQDPDEAHKHQFATTSAHVLHFGHGRQGCPGRFMASNIIKMVLGSLLLGYDFKLPQGVGRPCSLPAFEYSFPNPTAKILFKEKPPSSE